METVVGRGRDLAPRQGGDGREDKTGPVAHGVGRAGVVPPEGATGGGVEPINAADPAGPRRDGVFQEFHGNPETDGPRRDGDVDTRVVAQAVRRLRLRMRHGGGERSDDRGQRSSEAEAFRSAHRREPTMLSDGRGPLSGSGPRAARSLCVVTSRTRGAWKSVGALAAATLVCVSSPARADDPTAGPPAVPSSVAAPAGLSPPVDKSPLFRSIPSATPPSSSRVQVVWRDPRADPLHRRDLGPQRPVDPNALLGIDSVAVTQTIDPSAATSLELRPLHGAGLRGARSNPLWLSRTAGAPR